MSMRRIIGLAVVAVAAVGCSDTPAVTTEGRIADEVPEATTESSMQTKPVAAGLTIEELAGAVVNAPHYAGADYSIARTPAEAVAEATVVIRGRVVGLEVGPTSESPFSYIAEETGGPEQRRVTLGLRIQDAGGAEYVVVIPISDGQADRVATVIEQYVDPLVAEGLQDAELVVAGDLVEDAVKPAGASAVVLGARSPERTVILAAPNLDAWGITDIAEVERRMREGLET